MEKERIKFAHLADCHIGGWREQKLRDLGVASFSKAVDDCIGEKVDFVLIAGDLFNTAVPSMDCLKDAVKKLSELKARNIPVYAVAGSHDFSPSGKTILDVIEQAGLLVNVSKGKVADGKLHLHFTIDRKTGARLTGLPGKKGMLDKQYYEHLAKEDLESAESEDEFKIFLFHTAVSEIKKPEFEHMDSLSISYFPKGFNYYAGGHVHIVDASEINDYKNIVYPGPTFPNSFSEIEKLKSGGFYVVEAVKKSSEWSMHKKFMPIKIADVFSMKINCEGKNPAEVGAEILNQVENKSFSGTIVTIRLFGKLKDGKINDISLNDLFSLIYEQGAYFVMRNTYSLSSPEFEEIKFDTSKFEDVEEAIINEHISEINLDLIGAKGSGMEHKIGAVKNLLNLLSTEKLEGERNSDFEKRLCTEIREVIDV